MAILLLASPSSLAQDYWYYCKSSGLYYPNATTCAEGFWQMVPLRRRAVPLSEAVIKAATDAARAAADTSLAAGTSPEQASNYAWERGMQAGGEAEREAALAAGQTPEQAEQAERRVQTEIWGMSPEGTRENEQINRARNLQSLGTTNDPPAGAKAPPSLEEEAKGDNNAGDVKEAKIVNAANKRQENESTTENVSATLDIWHGLLAIIALAVVFSIYFLPSIVASRAGHRNTAAVFILNLFLGWTLIGWVIALVWAVSR